MSPASACFFLHIHVSVHDCHEHVESLTVLQSMLFCPQCPQLHCFQMDSHDVERLLCLNYYDIFTCIIALQTALEVWIFGNSIEKIINKLM